MTTEERTEQFGSCSNLTIWVFVIRTQSSSDVPVVLPNGEFKQPRRLRQIKRNLKTFAQILLFGDYCFLFAFYIVGKLR